MAGKPQKPHWQLQDQRPSRMRKRMPCYPPPPAEAQLAQRDAAIGAALGQVERQFRAAEARHAAATTPGERKRRYARKGERSPNAKQAERAQQRPRDERGHFLPDPNSRRNRRPGVPAALVGVTGTEEAVLAEVSRRPERELVGIARSFGRGSLVAATRAAGRPPRPKLLEIADELGDQELDQVIAALVKLRDARRREDGT